MNKPKTVIRRLSQLEIAEIFGITPRQIRNWTADGCPRNRDGSYFLRDVMAWLNGDL